MKEILMIAKACEACIFRPKKNKDGTYKKKNNGRLLANLSGLLLSLLLGINFFAELVTLKNFNAPQELYFMAYQSFLSSIVAYLFFFILISSIYFYFPKGQEIFRSMPIPGEKLFLARMYLSLYLSIFDGGLLLLAMNIAFCIFASLSWVAYIMTFLITLVFVFMIPMLTFALITLLRPVFRYPDNFVGTLIFTIIASVGLGVTMSLAQSSFSIYGETLEEIQEGFIQAMQILCYQNWIGFIPAKMMFAPTGEALLNLFYLLLIFGGSALLCFIVAKYRYVRLLMVDYVSKKRKEIGISAQQKKFVKIYREKPFVTFLRREFNLIKKTPILVLYGVITPLCTAILSSVLYGAFNTALIEIPEITEEMIWMIITSFYLFSLLSPYVAFASFSMEKDNIQALKALPLSANKLIAYKLILAALLNIPLYLYSTIFFSVMSGVEVSHFFIFIFLGLAFFALQLTLSSYLGVAFYNFHYRTPNEILHNSIGALILLVSNLVLLSIFAGLHFALSLIVPPLLSSIILLMMAIGLSVLFVYLAMKRAQKVLEKDF